MKNPEAMQTIARAGREALRRVWAMRDERESLTPSERELVDLLEAHKEYRPFWEGAEPEAQENPFLHVSMHQVVQGQLAKDEPAGVRAAFKELLEAGFERHAAEHVLMEALTLELSRVLKREARFDEASYLERIASAAERSGPGREAD